MKTPYTPRGKIVPFIEAVKADPDRVWTIADIAKVMELHSRKVGGSLVYAERNGVVFRAKRDGRLVYSGKPFPDGEAPPEPKKKLARRKEDEGWATQPDDMRIPRVVPGWVPPQMVAPRGAR